MDPGNWATDLAAGAFGYRLLWVVLAASAIALVLQLAVMRWTLASGEEFGPAIARRWPGASNALWAVYQSAAVATDLAEFTGIVLGLQLLLGLSLPVAVGFGFAATVLLLALGARNAKRLEYVLVALIGAICIALASQLPMLHPDIPALVRGAVVPDVPPATALLAVIGIIGATVMPHNLFLHSALVGDALRRGTSARRARRFFDCETIVALTLAGAINAGLLVIAAALGRHDGDIGAATTALAARGGIFAAHVFAAGLLLCGLAASVTATLSGDVLVRAFSPVRIPAAVRRIGTLVPATLALLAGVSSSALLVWSQVLLALVLPLVLVPLLILVTQRSGVGRLVVGGSYVAAGICIAFDAVLLLRSLTPG